MNAPAAQHRPTMVHIQLAMAAGGAHPVDFKQDDMKTTQQQMPSMVVLDEGW
jgi:hypothetical protein